VIVVDAMLSRLARLALRLAERAVDRPYTSAASLRIDRLPARGADAVIYCPSCERPTAKRTDLDYFADDGTTGSVAGVACNPLIGGCGYIATDPGAAYVPDGGRVEIPPGMSAHEWLMTGLRRAGCRPRRRP